MSKPKPTTAIVERFRNVLDWYEVDKVELDLEKTVYELQYRFGPNWFLEARTLLVDGKWLPVVWPGRDGFNVQSPAHALVALGDRVTKFSCISTGMHFHKALAELLDMAGKIRAQQEQKS